MWNKSIIIQKLHTFIVHVLQKVLFYIVSSEIILANEVPTFLCLKLYWQVLW